MSEWKPGDVAMVRLDPETEIRVMYNGACWVGRKGAFYDLHASARPLAVIDPEDREQVERLTVALYAQVGEDLNDSGLPDGYSAKGVQAALREFAKPTPPKPDEPTGLGAVVEDVDGNAWVRTHATGYPWHASLDPADRNSTAASNWGGVRAARVLSPGIEVTP